MAARRPPLEVFFRRYVIAFVTASVFMGGAVFAVNYRISSLFDKAARLNVATAQAPPEGANYLLIGSDTRAFVEDPTAEEAFGDPEKQGGQRSDTMMVIHVEPNSQRTLFVSFPRDLIVNIPGVGRSKINAAFNSGPDKVVETLQTNFDIEIHHYLEVNFQTFEGIVDAIGNVPVYFPYPARDDFTGLYKPVAGCAALDGQAALAYVRSRHLEYFSAPKNRWLDASGAADLDRIKRQQEFIRTLAGIAVQKSLNNPVTADKAANEVVDNLTVDEDSSDGDLLALVDAFRTVNPDDTTSLDFQTIPNVASGDGGLLPKQPEAQTMADQLMDFSGNNKRAAPSGVAPADVKVKVLNGSGVVGVAKTTLDELVKQGFVAGEAANDPRGEVRKTEVRYKPGAREEGKLVLEYLEPAASLREDPNLKGADVAVVLGEDFSAIVIPTAATTAPAAPSVTAVPGAPSPTSATPTTTTTTTPSTEVSLPPESDFGPPAPRKPPC